MEPVLIKNPKNVVEISRFALISGRRGARHITPTPKRKKIACKSRRSCLFIGVIRKAHSLGPGAPLLDLDRSDQLTEKALIDGS